MPRRMGSQKVAAERAAAAEKHRIMPARWPAEEAGTNQSAKRDHLTRLLPDIEVFATPKPEQLLHRIGDHGDTDPGQHRIPGWVVVAAGTDRTQRPPAHDDHEREVRECCREPADQGHIERSAMSPVGQHQVAAVGALVVGVDAFDHGDAVPLRPDADHRVLANDSRCHPPLVDPRPPSGGGSLWSRLKQRLGAR